MLSSFSADQYLSLNSLYNVASSSSWLHGNSNSMGRASVIGGWPGLAFEAKLVNPSLSAYFPYALRMSSLLAPSLVVARLKFLYSLQTPFLCL